MTKGSSQRRAKAEWSRHIADAQRLVKAGSHADAVRPLAEAVRIHATPALLNDLGVTYLQTRRVAEAVLTLRRALAMDPSFARGHHNLALALLEAGDEEGAIAALRRAVSLAPELAWAHGRLAEILWQRGSRAEAAEAYTRAAAAEPDTRYGELCRAMALVAADRNDEAEAELRRQIARYPSEAMTHYQLGLIAQAGGRFDEANASFEATLAADPGFSAAYQGLASTRRFTEADRALIERMTARLAFEESSPPATRATADRHRMTLHFAIGKASDELGDTAGAMRHFQAANDLRHELGPFLRKDVEDQVGRLVARYTPDVFAAHASLGSSDDTPLLVFGMPRSGTTLLERVLSSHAEVRGGGELDFWRDRGPVWADAPADKLARAAGDLQRGYLAALRGTDRASARATDKMPFNFFWLGLIHLLFPNARLLHCRRNAVDTCLSIYTTPMRAKLGFASRFEDLADYHRLYRRVMAHWRAVLPADRLIEVDYEDLVSKPEEIARRVVELSGLPWDPACLRPDKNATTVATASHWQARQPIYRTSLERWRRYEPWVATLRRLLEEPHP